MHKKQFNYVVFICRANPFHVEHKKILDKALKFPKRLLFSLVVHFVHVPYAIHGPLMKDST